MFAREAVVHYKDEPAYRDVLTYCPGCSMAHRFTVEVFNDFQRHSGKPLPVWEWDGNLESPTFSPSLLCFSTVHICDDEHPPAICEDPDCEEQGHQILSEDWKTIPQEQWVRGHPTPHTKDPAWGNCHSFLKNGQWQFLPDSAHALAGKTVPMIPLPEWMER